MSQNDFNNNFKDKLDNYASGIDPDALWNDISDRVPQKKKRRVVFWWFGAFGLLLIFFGISASGLTNKTESGKQFTQTKIAAIPEIPISEAHSVVDEGFVSNAELISTLVSNEIETKKEEKISIVSVSNDAKTSGNMSQTFEKKMFTTNSIADQSVKETLSNSIQQIAQTENQSSSGTMLNARVLGKLSIEDKSRLDFTRLPFMDFKLLSIPERELPRVGKRRRTRVKTIKPERKHMLLVDYAAGALAITTNKNSIDLPRVNDGLAHSSQAARIQYAYFLNSRFYAKALVDMNISTKKFTASIRRDTIIPSSFGDQLLATNIYKNGVIDTENGIPEVLATYTRDVQKLNHFQSFDIGLGLGYIQKIGNLSLHLETSLTRSLSVNRSGLGIEGGTQRIKDLASIKNYYSQSPFYNAQMDLRLEFPLFNDISLALGGQYQHGFSNGLLNSSIGQESYSSIRGTAGIIKYW